MSDLPQPVSVGDETVYIPKCCVEGHDDCPHVINKDLKASKKNIGL
jgi:hypothetical protein